MAADAGFELAGVAPAGPLPDYPRFEAWVTEGYAGRMGYLTDHRARLRSDPRNLLESARSVVCVGKLYNGPQPRTAAFSDPHRAWISRYAWGDDYHLVLRRGIEALRDRMRAEFGDFDSRICVDSAPILERSLARQAGLGWIGRNTCLINQSTGSWFFLGELLVSLPLVPDNPPPDRCGTCRRCIDACPTSALIERDGQWVLDSRLCISYLTIELRGPIPDAIRPGVGRHIFGCDICQDVCPWNRRAPETAAFSPREGLTAPELDRMAAISEADFRQMFAGTPITRARYSGFLRNVCVAMGNARQIRFTEPLRNLAAFPDPVVAETARWALDQLE